MASVSGPPTEPAWRDAVRVSEDGPLASELNERSGRATGVRSISVTDLLAPRRAFWRLTGPPVPLAAARAARIDTGRKWHRAFERLLSAEGPVELRLRRDGIAGRIDAWTDRPIEFKTSTALPAPDELLADRPEHVEQLAIYCALTERPVGRLVTASPEPDGGLAVSSVDLAFRDLPGVRAEALRRAAALRAAFRDGRAAALPRCPWFARGCEFRSAGVCDCDGNEAAEGGELRGRLESVRPSPELDRSIGPRLASAVRSEEDSRVGRFREVVYPRRTFFERRDDERVPEARATELSPAYDRLIEAIEEGPVGEVASLPARSREPSEEIPAFRGVPYLARTSRAPSVPSARDLVELYPQYALELGFRCAASGTSRGYAFVAYERATDVGGPTHAFAFDFAPVTTFSRLWRTRVAALEHALRSGSPGALPLCPPWMFASCPYRDDCGCGEPTGRSQR